MIHADPAFVVLDSSVVLKWMLPSDEPFRAASLKIRDDLEAGKIEALIPDLLLYEIGNRLRLERHLLDREKKHVIDVLWMLPLFLIPLRKKLIQQTLAIAQRHQITYYDALFVSTAYSARSTLYTADEKLLQKVSSLPYCRHLKDYQG